MERFLPRVLALGHRAPALALLKAVDAYLVGPILGRALVPPQPREPPADWFRSPEAIHWMRPGGMGDWAVLAPFIEGTRRLRRHPEDTLWVTEAAYPFAEAYHSARGNLQVRKISLPALALAPPPGLLIQTDLFHPVAWVLSNLLRPRRILAPPFPDPRNLAALPPEPMQRTFQRLHPGVIPAPFPDARPQGGVILVFAAGNHPSRRLPPGTLAALLARGFHQGIWFGPAPGPFPEGWTLHRGPLPVPVLLRHLEHALAVVTPDSGPHHLAELLGTPSLGYFTSGEWERWGWPGIHKISLISSFSCTGCTRLALPSPCPHHWGCVHAEDADRLADLLLDLVGSSTARLS